MDRPSPALTGVLWLLAAPLLVSWGLGTTHPLLDLLAVPAATLLAVPAWLGLPGIVVAAALVALGERARGADRAIGAIGGVALLAHALAATRPLPWVVLACAARAASRSRGARSEATGAEATDDEPPATGSEATGDEPPATGSEATGDAPPGPADGDDPWRLPPRLLPWLGLLAWSLAARARPWGPGMLPDAVAGTLGLGVELLPPRWGGAIPAAAALGTGLLLARRARPDRRGALLGGLLALGAVATFGSDGAWVSAFLLGALAGAFPPRGAPSPARLLPPAIALCALFSLRLGATERWNCLDAGLDADTKWWMTDGRVRSIAVVPGNLPYLVLLRGDGTSLERLGTTGIVNETRTVNPPGGLLVSSGGVTPFARVVRAADGLRVEWWDAALMEVRATRTLDGGCEVADASMSPGTTAVRVACADGRVLRAARDGPDAPAGAPLVRSGAPTSLAGLDFVLRGGPLARAHLPPDSVRLGPWPSGLGVGPGHLFVARGPAGQLEVRGPDPPIPGRSPPAEPDRVRRALRNVLDRARVGVWPGAAAWSAWQDSVYVTSPVDGRVHLVDPLVTWHQESALIGAPPRQVVVDGTSGTLYGVNRCGIFEVRIKSTFPWRSTGDVEPEVVPESPVVPTHPDADL